jgi:D-alanyl-D-alanine carboxypeptidase (penicillin-binding protein 5/6)
MFRPGLALALWSILILSAGSAAARPFFPKVNGSHPGFNAALRVEAASVIIVDESSGRVVSAKNANQLRQAASLQKLVTALVIAEAGNLDKPVTVTAADSNCPRTKLPKSVGGTYTRRELLQAMLVVSANDAARALARDNSGSESAFGAKMTAMARRVGAINSVFKDSAGFTVAGQCTTATDMVQILKAAYANPVIRQANATKFLVWRKTDGTTQLLRNPLGILHRHPNCRGGKVGYTSAASDCVALVWEEDNTRLYGVALGGKSDAFWEQLAAAHKLLAYQVP